MTPAEFKTLRERLGLSAQAFGDLLPRRVNDRTVRYWEAGKLPIPADARDFIRRLDAFAEQHVQHALDTVRAAAEEQGAPPENISLLRYASDDELPAPIPGGVAIHSAITGRVREALEREGVPVRIIYYDADACAAWTRAEGLQNDSAGRSAWAAHQAGLLH